MKTVLLAALLLLVHLTIQAQTPPACSAPAPVQAHYIGDAKVMALRLMQDNPLWKDSIFVPQVLYQPIQDALMAVHNATQYPERDTVMECLDIHTFSHISPYWITVAASPQNAWVQNLMNNIIPTGDAQIDALLAKYKLKRKSHFLVSGQVIFTLQSEDYLQIGPLAALFIAIPTVNFAEAQGLIGDGNNIEFERVAGQSRLIFSAAWGDCPAGCISRRKWTFSVSPTCSVQFLGVTGPELTDELLPCSNSFECSTEPLCMDWLQDTLAFYVSQSPGNCNFPITGISLRQYKAPVEFPVFVLEEVIGSDAVNFRFYNCSSDLLGTCAITIAGQSCTNPSLVQYLDSPIIWDCTKPLPSAQNCGTSAAPSPKRSEIAFKIAPNPASSTVVLDFGSEEVVDFTTSIFDLQGRTVCRQTGSPEVNVAGLPAGVYLLRVETAQGMGMRKLVVE